MKLCYISNHVPDIPRKLGDSVMSFNRRTSSRLRGWTRERAVIGVVDFIALISSYQPKKHRIMSYEHFSKYVLLFVVMSISK